MKSLGEIKIDLFWTDNITKKAIKDFIKVQNEVFNADFNENKFYKKYIKNIYGPSIIVLAYKGGICVGARAFWRNDINDLKAYQPCDTAVLSEYRGHGIFREMTCEALKIIDGDTLIYNFPNDNSYPGYLKMGWKLYNKKKYKLYNPFKDYNLVDKIEKKYLKWVLDGLDLDFNKSLYYTRIMNSYYLIKRRKGNLYVIIGEIDEESTFYLSKAKFPICLIYSDQGHFGRGLVTVTRNLKREIYIPIYKIDTIF